MDTLLLETFIAVADAESFSTAGTILGVSQPVLSRRMRDLEGYCQARLLYRHGRGAKLTFAGELLYDHARALVAGVALALDVVANTNSQPSGLVTAALSPSLMRVMGAELLETMKVDYPQIRLQLVSGYSSYVLEWLLQARVDIGVLSGAGISSRLVSEELGYAPIVLVANPSMKLPPASANGALAFTDIAPIPLIVSSQSQGMRRYINMAAAKCGITLNIAYEIDDVSLTRDMVAAGKGATLISALAVLQEVESGVFVQRMIDAPRLSAHSMLATAPNRPVSPPMKSTIAAIKRISSTILTRAL